MKPLFGFNKTTEKPGYAHQFITKTITKALENEYDEIAQASFNINKKMENKVKKYSLLITVFGLILLGICLLFGFQDGFDKMWESRSWLCILGIIATIVGIVARIVSIFIKPKPSLLEDLKWNKEELENWHKKRDEYFAFPHEKYDIDILCPQYKEKNGEVKLEIPLGVYNNIPTIIYKQNDTLYISDNLSLYEIPFQNFVRLEKQEESRSFLNWTQSEPCTKEYQEKCNNQVYKMSASYKAKSNIKVIFNFEGEEYYFEVLPYDYEDIYKIFEVQVETKEENEK